MTATYASESTTTSPSISSDSTLTALHTLADQHGVPWPAHTLVHRLDDEHVALSLELADLDALRAWAAVVDTTHPEPQGPERIGPKSFVTVTGRLCGAPVVLLAEVPHDHPGDLERAEARELLRVREQDGPPTADHDTAGWRAAIDAADAAARQTPTEQP